jgi:hypothetical protein
LLESVLPGTMSEATFWFKVSHALQEEASQRERAYEIRQMDVAIGIEKHIVRFNITVNDALAVDVSQRAAQLGNPEPDGLFCKGFSRDMKPQVASAH